MITSTNDLCVFEFVWCLGVLQMGKILSCVFCRPVDNLKIVQKMQPYVSVAVFLNVEFMNFGIFSLCDAADCIKQFGW